MYAVNQRHRNYSATLSFRSEMGQQQSIQHTEQLTREYIEARSNHFKTLFNQVMGALTLQAFASAALLGLGGWLVIRRQLTLGQLVAAELIVGAVVAGIAKFGKYFESYYDLCAALEKINKFLELPTERKGTLEFRSEGPLTVQMNHVHFGYGNKKVLNGVHLNIAPGDRILICAKNSEGKSTLADVLYGLRLPEQGSIYFNGHDLRDINLSSLRQQTALIRHSEIFAETVSHNLDLGQSLDAGEYRHILEMLGLWTHIAALPHGLETHLATGGSPLSESQARLLTLARALLAHPKLIILDGLDYFDTETQKTVLSFLCSKKSLWTLIVLTHETHQRIPMDADHVYDLHDRNILDARKDV